MNSAPHPPFRAHPRLYRPRARLWLLAALAGVLIGCASPAPTVTPVPVLPSAVPASRTPAPSALPPSVVPPTAEPIARAALADAVARTLNAKAYRVELAVTLRGDFSAAGIAAPAAGSDAEPLTLLQLNGQVNGADAQFRVQGSLTANLGVPADQSFEIATYAGIPYLKGPVPLIGADKAIWYQLSAQDARYAQPPLSPAALLDSFVQTGVDLSDFKSQASASFDGQTCTVYGGSKSALVKAFGKIGDASGTPNQNLDTIDNAALKFWVCQDAYLHQLEVTVDGHAENDAARKGSFEVLIHYSDLDGNISLTPPSAAPRLRLMQAPAVSPTP